jgi:hypothetical protein
MKPCNFPARKQARREEALARILVAPLPSHYESQSFAQELRDEEINNIRCKLRLDARDVRTKKDRSARGRRRG